MLSVAVVVYIAVEPIDDAFAANDIIVVFDEAGHVVVAFSSTKDDDVLFNAEGLVRVVAGAKTGVIVALCTTFPVIFCCTGPMDVAFAVGATGVVSIRVTFGETDVIVPFSSIGVADVTFGAGGHDVVAFCAIRSVVVVFVVRGPTDDVLTANDIIVAFDEAGHVVVAFSSTRNDDVVCLLYTSPSPRDS